MKLLAITGIVKNRVQTVAIPLVLALAGIIGVPQPQKLFAEQSVDYYVRAGANVSEVRLGIQSVIRKKGSDSSLLAASELMDELNRVLDSTQACQEQDCYLLTYDYMLQLVASVRILLDAAYHNVGYFGAAASSRLDIHLGQLEDHINAIAGVDASEPVEP